MTRKKHSKARMAAGQVAPNQNGYVASIALLIALPEEREYFHEVISGRSNWTPGAQRESYFCIFASPHGDVRVAVKTLHGMGQIEAILGTSSIINTCSPDLAIMVGIAGSLDPDKVGLGDVVVSNQAKYFASDKVAKADARYVFGDETVLKNQRGNGKIVVDGRDRFLSDSFLRYERNFVESLDVDLLLSTAEQRFGKCPLKQLSPTDMPPDIGSLPSSQRMRKVHAGWLLGSHHVVDSLEYRTYLVEKNEKLSLDVHRQKGDHERVKWKSGQLLAVDMESYGMLRAVELSSKATPMQGGCANLIGGIAVRGISDLCEHKDYLDQASKERFRKLAAQNATEVCLTLLENLNYEAILQNRKPQLVMV